MSQGATACCPQPPRSFRGKAVPGAGEPGPTLQGCIPLHGGGGQGGAACPTLGLGDQRRAVGLCHHLAGALGSSMRRGVHVSARQLGVLPAP